MPEQNQPLKPTPFEPVQPQRLDSAGTATATKRSALWLPTGLAVLAVAAVLVFFWLPGNVPSRSISTDEPGSENGQSSAPIATPSTTEEAAVADDSTTQQTPWADAQQARLRLEAQDVLAELIDLQFALEEQGVQTWAPGRFADAAALATQGDVYYRQQAYLQASESYRQGLQILQETADSIPQRVETLLQDAAKALESADLEIARESIASLEAIEPENSALPELQQRLTVLPELIAALGKARKFEEAREFASAADQLQHAIALDPTHRGAAQALDRVNNQIRESDFQTAMSRGYGMLNSDDYNNAIREFESAETLKPGSAEAASAIAEAKSLRSAAQLIDLKNRGSRYESKEQWRQAVDTYEAALAIDNSILFAREGIERSRERLTIAQEFKNIMADPDRLTNETVASKARTFLHHSENMTPRGPVLQSQLAALEELLRHYSTPVTVALASDSQTEVVIYKVGKLGTFEQRSLQLRPGTYTATGSRLGYRDVRKTFRVGDAEAPLTVTIVCTEPI